VGKHWHIDIITITIGAHWEIIFAITINWTYIAVVYCVAADNVIMLLGGVRCIYGLPALAMEHEFTSNGECWSLCHCTGCRETGSKTRLTIHTHKHVYDRSKASLNIDDYYHNYTKHITHYNVQYSKG
jgi:hypothetical protein